jgi:hypothetical protein
MVLVMVRVRVMVGVWVGSGDVRDVRISFFSFFLFLTVICFPNCLGPF